MFCRDTLVSTVKVRDEPGVLRFQASDGRGDRVAFLVKFSTAEASPSLARWTAHRLGVFLGDGGADATALAQVLQLRLGRTLHGVASSFAGTVTGVADHARAATNRDFALRAT